MTQYNLPSRAPSRHPAPAQGQPGMNTDEQIKALKALVTQQDARAAYDAGNVLLADAPGHEYASYATAWASFKLGEREACLAYIAPALALKPENFNYLSLHAQSCLALGRYAEALPHFQKMATQRPLAPAVWRALLKIRAEFQPELPLPRNVMVLTDDIAKAYRGRHWEQCRLLLAELAEVEPLSARYWQLLADDFLSLQRESLDAWRQMLAYANERLADTAAPVSPLVDRNIPYLAFSNYFSCLVKGGDTDGVMAELPKFRTLYRRPCPVKFAVAIAALLLRDQRHAECIEVLERIEAELPNEMARGDFRLQLYSSRWACRQALLPAAGAGGANQLSDGLVDEMVAVLPPQSPQRLVLDDFLLCWKTIRASSERLLLDVRFDGAQLATLKALIKDALAGRGAFSLVRLGDGEAYGFRDVVPQLYAGAAPLDIDRSVESMWWGRALEEPRRRQLADGFLAALGSADVIGFPGALRMARDLRGGSAVQSALPSVLDLKYRVLFSGMRTLLEQRRAGAGSWWVDEFCNIALSDATYLGELMAAAAAVVVVSCFEIPPGHLFDDPKVSVLAVPPVRKMAALGTTQFGAAILPDLLDELAPALARLAGPGVLVLVGAGFAGKSLLAVAKAAGAVALDVGSGIDAAMGYQTRSLELGVQASAVVAQRFPLEAAGAPAAPLGPVFEVAMEELNQCGRAPLYIHRRARSATSTSVKLLDRNTFVSCSFVGQRAYLVRFDEERGTSEVVGSVDTTYAGEKVETDSCDADADGNVITTNFYLGNATLYRCRGGQIAHVRDLPLNLGGFVHGVKFFRPGIFAVTAASGRTGVHFFSLDSCAPLLHVPSDLKTQDIHFLSERRMVVLFACGAPKTQHGAKYHSEVHIVDFRLEDRTFKVVARMTYENAHLDCCASAGGKLYITDQYNDRVMVLDPQTLKPLGQFGGYDFPHGIDIRFDTLAVSNYGSNRVRIQRFRDPGRTGVA
jgi:tetratricopeptide (TPR) repeat protein